MSAVPATIVPTIGKLIPRLASDYDAEILATVRAIERLLKSAGHDWHDLAASITKPTIQRSETDWRQEARFCVANASLLNERELDFVATIAQQHRSPTVKQRQWLADIADRLRSDS